MSRAFFVHDFFPIFTRSLPDIYLVIATSSPPFPVYEI